MALTDALKNYNKQHVTIDGPDGVYVGRELDGVSSSISTIIRFLKSPVLVSSNNLSDVANAATARTNLGLGSAATHPSTDFLSSTVPCFSVHKNSTDQTGIASATFTTITWPTEIYDVGNYFASSKWTPPAGKVHLDFAYYSDGSAFTSGGTCIAAIAKNGTIIKEVLGQPVGTSFVSQTVSADDVANGTDYYEAQVMVTLTSGTAIVRGYPFTTYFNGHWFSP